MLPATKFKLMREPDDGALTAIFVAARTHPATFVTQRALVDWLAVWSEPTAIRFVSPTGFVGALVSGTQAELTLVQAAGGSSVNVEFADGARQLLRELVPALGVAVLRAVTASEPADRLLELAGLRYDGTLRRLLTLPDGSLADAGCWSLLPSDLAEPIAAAPLTPTLRLVDTRAS
jgi:hypothetical protein